MLFRAFDVNGDGYVCASDLVTALGHVAGTGMHSTHLTHVAASTVAMFDCDNDDRLDQHEFGQMLQGGEGVVG